MVTEEICGWESADNTTEATQEAEVSVTESSDEAAVPLIAWPFIISGVWCMLFSLGFLLLAKLPFQVY